MPEYIIEGIPVNFPFEPYDVQKVYMEKVINCLKNGTNGVLESPTGTGKTLSLLCSTLAWILSQKAKFQLDVIAQKAESKSQEKNSNLQFNHFINLATSKAIPKVIYSSRTHSQLAQVVGELKRTTYSFMRAVVLGSRDQLCVHPEVSKETSNAIKTQMCKIHITTRSCSFYNNFEKQKDNSDLYNQSVVDIEDLITVGRKARVCPYFMSKESVDKADIIFIPYNYLLDPKARKGLNINLENSVIIIDEAHNIEKMCEESASAQIKSSDIALCIDDITQAMKLLNDNGLSGNNDDEKDFTLDDLVQIKEKLLELEKIIDDIEITNKAEGITFPAQYMFDLLGKANINFENHSSIIKLIDNILQYMMVVSSGSDNSAFRKGVGLERLQNFLMIVFTTMNDDTKDKIFRSFKVHIEIEESKLKKNSPRKSNGGWITTTKSAPVKVTAKMINYWCFNPGFGMEQLLRQKVRSIIFTSGTLAPLKPLISELGIPISNQLENPHIIDKSQVYVRVIPFGPDKESLNSNFKNRDNPKYVKSLGNTIAAFSRIIPGGVLVFFPSYPLMNNCRDSWQASGVWSQINKFKPIFVEPRDKETFTSTMSDFYSKIQDPNFKGACFMAVCRGKVSEGLDFADLNGRAVIITGLPYPPLKDPRIILKRRYLEDNRTKENELVTGDHWYGLEASRAVNQAIGRVIRHKNDYGVILLCDSRFSFPQQKSQLSSWIQGHLKAPQQTNHFGIFIREIVDFFRNAKELDTKLTAKRICDTPSFIVGNPSSSITNNQNYSIKNEIIDIDKSNVVSIWSSSNSTGDVERNRANILDVAKKLFDCPIKGEGSESSSTFSKRSTSPADITNNIKKKKLKMIMPSGTDSIILENSCEQNQASSSSSTISDPDIQLDRTEMLKLIKRTLPTHSYRNFLNSILNYKKNEDVHELFDILKVVFSEPSVHYLLRNIGRFVKDSQKDTFYELINSYFNKN